MPPEDLGSLPDDAQDLVAGFVAYGADVSEGEVPVNGRDSYFLNDWWDLLVPQLSHAPGSSSGAAQTHGGNGGERLEPQDTAPTQLVPARIIDLDGSVGNESKGNRDYDVAKGFKEDTIQNVVEAVDNDKAVDSKDEATCPASRMRLKGSAL